MIATSVVLLVMTGIGNRWFAAGRRVARLTAVTTMACAVTIKVLALGMVLLSAQGGLTPWVLFLVFILVPFSVTATQARRTLALCCGRVQGQPPLNLRGSPVVERGIRGRRSLHENT